MTIEELGSLGELIGSFAVLISLIYLGIQVRRSTDTARTSTYQSVVADFSALNRAIADSPDLSLLYVQAMEDFGSLDPGQKARMSQVFYMTFRNFENMFYQHQKGYSDEDVWIGWKRLMLNYHARPGFQSWWAVRRDTYNPQFVEFLRNEKIDKPIASYRDITELQSS